MRCYLNWPRRLDAVGVLIRPAASTGFSDPRMKKTLRIYYVTHDNGWLTGTLMRTWGCWFDTPPPAAYGMNEEDIERQLEVRLQELEVRGGEENTERYLWEETFHMRKVAVDVHPQALVKKRSMIGSRTIPLRLNYAWSELPGGGYRVILPRFDYRCALEDLALAPEVLRNAISASLLGEDARWVYDFREQGPEFVREWAPDWLKRRAAFAPRDAEEAPTLAAVAQEWVEKAARRKLPLIVGEEPSVAAAAALVERDPPVSLLIVGPAGVGKTTWVRRLAVMLAGWRRDKERPRRTPRLWATSAQQIISGMVYLGMWQERCLKLIEEIEHEGDYLFVDRLPDILANQPGGSSIGAMLEPGVLSGAISLIAECSEEEFERCQRRSPGMVGAMHVLRLDPTPRTAMPALLQLYQRRRGHRLTIHPEGMRRLVSHLEAFDRLQHFPGKGLRFLDWLAQTDQAEHGRTLYPNDISRTYARFSGLPIELISDDHPTSHAQLTDLLTEAVIGQDAACADAARILTRFKAGLDDPDRPCGSLFFVGPTGVGKTELARQLARVMFGDPDRMIRLDMSEYMSPGSSQRLLAIGPGVTSLAEQVRQRPLSHILLDEIAKAHPEVVDLLRGVLGEGRLTDALGRLVDFRMTLVVMTSNLGAGLGAPPGFGATPAVVSMGHLRDHFRPEFLGRLDRVCAFNHLDPDALLKIVKLELRKAAGRSGLTRRNLRLVVTDQARAHLARIGYDPDFGARPLRRVVEERVMTPIAVLLAKDPALANRDLVFDSDGEDLSLKF